MFSQYVYCPAIKLTRLDCQKLIGFSPCLLHATSFFILGVLLFVPPTAYGVDVLVEVEKRIVQLYRKTNEAVVFISTQGSEPDTMGFSDSKRSSSSSDHSRAITGAGTGVIVDAEKRIILTSLHVISDAESIQILLADGKNYPARLLGHDPESDVAVLQLTDAPRTLTAIPFSKTRKLEVGQMVFAIGNPHGLARTFTSGIISSLHRTVRSPKQVLLKDLIQTDVALNPGSSGGPLLNIQGEIIGINAAILSQSGDSAGISFAVPIQRIQSILPELIATGKVLRARLGWVLVDTNQGPLVRRLLPGGPAERAGIEPLERPVGAVFESGIVRNFDSADLIMRVNGKRVLTVDDVEDAVLAARRGQPIELVLRRGGKAEDERKIVVKPVLQ